MREKELKQYYRKKQEFKFFLKTEVNTGDWLVVAFFFFITVFSFFRTYGGVGKGTYFKVFVSGKNVAAFSLYENGIKSIEGKTGTFLLEVLNGEVFVKHAPCRGKVCIGMGSIGKEGGIIVCAPSGIIVEVVGKKENDNHNELDGVTK